LRQLPVLHPTGRTPGLPVGTAMDLTELQENWNRFGKEDPLWSILTVPAFRDNRWSPEEFFKTGRAAVADLVVRAQTMGLVVGSGRALDFGCGVGRLTQALAEDFDQVIGIDIAPSMIEKARAFNMNEAKVEYLLNESDNLELLSPGFDLILSEITLMHIETRYARRYIAEFVRLLSGDGLAVFQLPLPTAKQRIRAGLPQRLVHVLNRIRSSGKPKMEIYGMREVNVRRIVAAAGGSVVKVEHLAAAHGASQDRRYWVRKVG